MDTKRKKTGRKPRGDKAAKRSIRVRVTEEEHAILREAAEMHDITVSGLIRLLAIKAAQAMIVGKEEALDDFVTTSTGVIKLYSGPSEKIAVEVEPEIARLLGRKARLESILDDVQLKASGEIKEEDES